MKQVNVFGMGCLLAGMLLTGCSATGSVHDETPTPVAEVDMGLLGDLNQYVGQLLGQRTAGNGEAEKVLVRLLNGDGLPEPVPLIDKKA